jgi:hypothetical protein
MSVAHPETVDVSEIETVIQWRTEVLERAGYDRADALLLAFDPCVDLHRASDLLRDGCPPETAIRILV